MGSSQSMRFGRRTFVEREQWKEKDELKGYLERIAALTYLPVTETGEATQITEYQPGEYYDFHWDTNLELARQATFLLYLSDPDPLYAGGETAFPLLRKNGSPRYSASNRDKFFRRRRQRTAKGYTRAQRVTKLHRECTKGKILKIAPKKGRAIFWFNFDAGESNPSHSYRFMSYCCLAPNMDATFSLIL